jgi:hypothetical protein
MILIETEIDVFLGSSLLFLIPKQEHLLLLIKYRGQGRLS